MRAFHETRDGWRYRRTGFFVRRAAPARVQRFRCVSCGRSLSVSSFSTTCRLRRPELFFQIVRFSTEGAGLREIGRKLGVSHTTVARHLAQRAVR